MKCLNRLLAALAVASAGVFSIGLGIPATSHASVQQDQQFYYLLTRPDQDYPMVVWDFPLIRAQAIRACQLEDAGLTAMQVTYDLDQRYGGPYPFEGASSITSAAEVIYCRWHLEKPVDVSTPVYPPPVYPPLMWVPTPTYYAPTGGVPGAA